MEDTESKPETYWTCFAYDGHHPDDLHCTHKYLGHLEPNELAWVRVILDGYFGIGFEPFQVSFDKEEFFGAEGETRVLLPSYVDMDLMLMDLRFELDQVRADDWPDYKPHVSSPDRDRVSEPFTRYCLMQGDTIIKEYR